MKKILIVLLFFILVGCDNGFFAATPRLSPQEYFKYEFEKGEKVHVFTEPQASASKQMLSQDFRVTLSAGKDVHQVMENVRIKLYLSIRLPGYMYFRCDGVGKGYNGYVFDNLPVKDKNFMTGWGAYEPTPLEEKQVARHFIFHKPGRHFVQWKGDIQLCKEVDEKSLKCLSEEKFYAESNVLEIKVSEK